MAKTGLTTRSTCHIIHELKLRLIYVAEHKLCPSAKLVVVTNPMRILNEPEIRSNRDV